MSRIKWGLGGMVPVIVLALAWPAGAVTVGEGAREPSIHLYVGEDNAKIEDFDATSPGLETLGVSRAESIVPTSGHYKIVVHERIKIHDMNGILLYKSPKLTLTTAAAYDEMGSYAEGFECNKDSMDIPSIGAPPEPKVNNGTSSNSGIAEYGGATYIVHGLGVCLAEFDLTGVLIADYSKYKVRVIRQSDGVVMATPVFKSNSLGVIDPSQLVVKDFNRDGDDDFIVVYRKPLPAQRLRTTVQVRDLLNPSTVLHQFNYIVKRKHP